MRFGIAVALATTLAAPRVSAQAVPNLSGTWVMQADKSTFGQMPGPQARTDVINHQEPKLTIKRTTVSTQGEQTADLVYAVDGKPYKNMVGPNELTSTLSWEGQTLVMVSLLASPQGEITITDRYSLSADGKLLTIARNFSAGGESISQTLVLAKQP